MYMFEMRDVPMGIDPGNLRSELQSQLYTGGRKR